jgi:ABC-2 type transport system ATP-binding protein
MSADSSSGRPPIPAIEATSLIKGYRKGDPPALVDFSLTIAAGEFIGLLGPNGAGKTTAISILCGLMRPGSGTVCIHGMTYNDNRSAIKKNTGIVPQEIALYDRLSGRENLVFFGRLMGLGGGRLREQIEKCLDIAQLAERADHPVAAYSGGMKRRLNLAIGLLNDPQILFLDEPTVGIDTQSRHLIHSRLLELHRQGTTIIYTTHYMEEAQELCSRVAVLDKGRILLQGRPNELLRETGYRNLEELFLGLTGKQLRDI